MANQKPYEWDPTLNHYSKNQHQQFGYVNVNTIDVNGTAHIDKISFAAPFENPEDAEEYKTALDIGDKPIPLGYFKPRTQEYNAYELLMTLFDLKKMVEDLTKKVEELEKKLQ